MRYRYTKFTPNLIDELDIDDLVGEALGPAAVERVRRRRRSVDDADRTMQALHDAILEALFNGGVLPPDLFEQLFGREADGADRTHAGAARPARAADPADHRPHEGVGLHHDAARPRTPRGPTARRAGGPAKASPGTSASRSPTRPSTSSATARCATCSDRSATAASAATTRATSPPASRPAGRQAVRVRRHAQPRRDRDAPQRRRGGRGVPARPRLRGPAWCAQGEYQSSCATVLMLDCSHSMILYGEDRFTPAKRVALALVAPHPHAVSRATRSTRCSSTTAPRRSRFATWPRAGGAVLHEHARRPARWRGASSSAQRKDMRQIVMITDGKPSALTHARRADLQELRWVSTRS